MASGYTKIFGSMLDSTVWQLSKEARLLWITMLLKKDRDQVVRTSVPGLAHVARLTLQETLKALEELQKPDPYSQSKKESGRRIIPHPRGFMVVNGEEYRDMMNAEDRREYNRVKQAEHRAKKKGPSAREIRYEKQFGDGQEPDVLKDKPSDVVIPNPPSDPVVYKIKQNGEPDEPF